MVDIICSDPLHDTRSAESGWSATLGTVPDGATPPSGMYCAACASHIPRAIPDDAGAIAQAEPMFYEEVYSASNVLLSRAVYAAWDGTTFSQKVEEVVRSYQGQTLLSETLSKYDAAGNCVSTTVWKYITVRDGSLTRLRKVRA